MHEEATINRRGRGQVLVEVLLMLPVFMFLVFTIMDIGHLAFRTILLHHAAYEVARFGSMTARTLTRPGCPTPALRRGDMQRKAREILPSAVLKKVDMTPTLLDDQERCMNYDVVVILEQNVPMIFPMTGVVLSNTSSRSSRLLMASVRMPVERPLFK